MCFSGYKLCGFGPDFKFKLIELGLFIFIIAEDGLAVLEDEFCFLAKKGLDLRFVFGDSLTCFLESLLLLDDGI